MRWSVPNPARIGIQVSGIPESVPEAETAILRSRLMRAAQEFMSASKLNKLELRIYTASSLTQSNREKEGSKPEAQTLEKRAAQYRAIAARFSWDFLVVSSAVRAELELSLGTVRLARLLFENWGLAEISGSSRVALNLHGKPGTGKTLAAHCIADSLGMQIIEASYAHIESMYHGEGPKNVEALFYAAEAQNAILFIDEADSLLSRRLTNVSQGSEQAINSMRSQLLICLERFKGVVIFATNLVANYDPAFDTRIRHIEFPIPDAECREKIWRQHLPSRLPLTHDVSIAELSSKTDGFVGRDIRRTVMEAATMAALSGAQVVSRPDLIGAIERLRISKDAITDARTLAG